MKKGLIIFYAAFSCVFLSSCEVIEGIFKAGFWTGFLLVIVVIVAVILLLANIFKKK
jgi:hypothetical protein